MDLTNDQKKALRLAKQGKNLFITGGGGVGKTYLIDRIVSDLKNMGKNVLKSASTGKAAMLIGGETCHRLFRIPIKMTWASEPRIKEDSPLYKADTIIIDEVSMLRMDTFDFIVKTIELVNSTPKRKAHPIQLIVVGDFCQLPPVIVRSSNKKSNYMDEAEILSEHYGFDIGQGYAFLAPSWANCHFEICELKEVIRQSDKEMIHALNNIRFGRKDWLTFFDKNQNKDFAKTNAVHLCGKNATADRINNAALDRLPGKAKRYIANIHGEVNKDDKQAPDILDLKVGAHVILLQNTEKYRNGSDGIIENMYPNSVTVRILDTDEVVDIPYASWDIERYVLNTGTNEIEKKVVGTFSQLPLRLGYAVTIHKSQGQTYSKAVLALGNENKKENGQSIRPEIFAYGQLYVGLSRVSALNGLYIEGDLNQVDILAAPEVLDFYNAAKGKDSNPDRIKEKKAVPPKKRKKVYDPKKETITFPESKKAVIWAFVSTLDPSAKLMGEKIEYDGKYKDQVSSFLKIIMK